MVVGGCIIPKDDDEECKFQTYMGSDLVYEMLCDTSCLDHEEKEGDNISSNSLINFKYWLSK